MPSSLSQAKSMAWHLTHDDNNRNIGLEVLVMTEEKSKKKLRK